MKNKFIFITLVLICILTGCAPSVKELSSKVNKQLNSPYIEAKGYGTIDTRLKKNNLGIISRIRADNVDITLLNDGDSYIYRKKGQYNTEISEETKDALSVFNVDIKERSVFFDTYIDKDYIYNEENRINNKINNSDKSLYKFLIIIPPEIKNESGFEIIKTNNGYELKKELSKEELFDFIKECKSFSYKDIEEEKNNKVNGTITYTLNDKYKLISSEIKINNFYIESEDVSGEIDLWTEIKYISFKDEGKLSVPNDKKKSKENKEPILSILT